MPENPANLHVVGRTADGGLVHTIRSPGGWTPFGDVFAAAGLPGLRGHAVDVTCARRRAITAAVVEGLYVLVALDDQPPRLLLRNADNGTWSQQPGAFLPTARRVAVGTLTTVGPPFINRVDMAAVTDDGHLVIAGHDFTAAQPALPDDVELTAGETGELRGVALSAIVAIGLTDVPMLAVTADGGLLQTTGRPGVPGQPGQWSTWIQVIAGVVGQPLPADAVDAALTREGVLLVTGDGRVWLAAALPSGLLGPWRDLELSAGGLVDVGTFATVAGASTSEGLHVVGTTTDGRLWHQLRNNPAVVFRDVESVGVGQDVGSFTAVDCG